MSTIPRIFGRKGDIEYSLCTEEDWEGVQEILLKSFCMNEPVSIGCELNLPENEQSRNELANISLDLVRLGMSIVARDVVKNKVIGHAINSLMVRGEDGNHYYFVDLEKKTTGCTPNIQAFCNFNLPTDVLKLHNIDCTFDIIFLGTMSGYEGAGIGRSMCEYSLQLARRLQKGELPEMVSEEIRRDARRPQAVSGNFTSAFSQRIAARLGMVCSQEEIRYTEYEYGSKKIADRLPKDSPHTVAVMMSMKL